MDMEGTEKGKRGLNLKIIKAIVAVADYCKLSPHYCSHVFPQKTLHPTPFFSELTRV